MKKVNAVIGSGWGDEGKGVITDNIVSSMDTLVVRYNSGAQAAHTVDTGGGVRHIFGHFGSGTLKGAKTFLSRFFVSSPTLFVKEFKELNRKGFIPKVYVHEASYVTTPYDVLINQIVERYRSKLRHGSCGVGFGETIERHETSLHSVSVSDLSNRNYLKHVLGRIRSNYVLDRLEALGVEDSSLIDFAKDIIGSYTLESDFLNDVDVFLGNVTICDDDIIKNNNNVVFEGAQGLLLDQEHSYFPHVTRSYTGINNVDSICNEVGIESLNTNYITRIYATRHGAGPFPREVSGNMCFNVNDQTNQPNEFQGSLRIGYLDLDLLSKSIKEDMAQSSLILNPKIIITCVDQMNNNKLEYFYGGELIKTQFSDLLMNVYKSLDGFKISINTSPRRNGIMSIC